MVKENDFDSFKAKSLVVSNPEIPLMYALPKTHKPGKKMRLIVSCCNSPTMKLSKWITSELQNLSFQKEFEVKNTEEAVEKLNHC